MLRLEGVRFSYPDGTAVLQGISESIEAGTTLGVVGPSGCGKSTLLALIAGLLEPSEGTIERPPPEAGRHPLSMVFQKDTLLPWLTVGENVRLFSRFKSHGRRSRFLSRRGRGTGPEPPAGDGDLDDRVAELLELVHLDDSADRYPYQLSGGMRRRLAFLAAVAPNPEILLLDEPFSSLDEPTRVDIHQDVFRISRMMEMTTVLVTHDLAEAISICDRVVILSSRPASVAEEHVVPFGNGREMLALRETPEFLDLYGHLWHDLSAQIQASGPGRSNGKGAASKEAGKKAGSAR